MKTIIKLILITYCIFHCSFSIGQTEQQRIVLGQEKEIKTSKYIFEGTVTKQYKDTSGNWICSIIEVTKIYKGTPLLKLGSIKVLMELGWMDGLPIIHKGTYIIFGSLAKLSLIGGMDTVYATDNSLILQCMDHIDIHGASASWGVRHPLQYKSLDSLYSFFRENGVTVQEEAPAGGGK